jgi:hypothetical protein
MMWKVSSGGGTARVSGRCVMTSEGTVRGLGGTLRLGGGNSGQNRIRPSLLNLTPLPQSTQNPKSSPQRLKVVTPDPYDLMRRNRLGGINNTEESLQLCTPETSRVRAKSSSPPRRKSRRSPSPIVTRTAQSETSSFDTQKGLSWDREPPNRKSIAESSDSVKRKSILECDVNAYELIAKYLKNGNRCKVNGDTTGMKIGECGRSEFVSSDDDVLDDELSDDLSDNALEDLSAGISDNKRSLPHKRRVQNAVSSCSKTDDNTNKSVINNRQAETHILNGISAETVRNTSVSTSSRPIGVTLGGQRIRIFNEPRAPPLPEEDNINIDIDAKIASEFTRNNKEIGSDHEINDFDAGDYHHNRINRSPITSLSHIPRLASPRRPPRRMKATAESSSDCIRDVEVFLQDVEGASERESRVVNSANTAATSLSESKAARSSTAVEGGCIIKSILKKPSSSSPGEISTSLRTFSDTVSKPDPTLRAAVVNSAPSGHQHSGSPAAPSLGSSDFYLPTFQEYKQQHRKKKQVQFRVANEVTESKRVEDGRKLDVPVTNTGKTTAATGATVITAQVSPVIGADDGVDEPNDGLSSVETDKWTRPDKQEEEPLRHERRTENTSVKQEENQSDFKKQDFDVEGNCKAPICNEDEDKSSVNDDVGAGGRSGKVDVCSEGSVKLQYFGASSVEVVNSGDVSSDKETSRSGTGSNEDVADDWNSADNEPEISGGNSDSTAATSGEYLHKYYAHCCNKMGL